MGKKQQAQPEPQEADIKTEPVITENDLMILFKSHMRVVNGHLQEPDFAEIFDVFHAFYKPGMSPRAVVAFIAAELDLITA